MWGQGAACNGGTPASCTRITAYLLRAPRVRAALDGPAASITRSGPVSGRDARIAGNLIAARRAATARDDTHWALVLATAGFEPSNRLWPGPKRTRPAGPGSPHTSAAPTPRYDARASGRTHTPFI